MYRLAVTAENLTKAYDAPVIVLGHGRCRRKIVIIGANGVDFTLLRLLATRIAAGFGLR